MPDLPDTEDLIRRAQGGDVAAFEQLIEAHIPQIRRMARAFCHNTDGVDDLAQDALLKVYRSIGSYRFQAAFSTWLFSISRNCFLDHIKSRAARERLQEAPLVVANDLQNEAQLSPEAALDRHQERNRLWHAIGQLPPESRTVVVFFDIEGKSYDEIAAIEKVALGTVKSRLSRGREALRRLLTPAPGPGNLSAMNLVSPDKGRDRP